MDAWASPDSSTGRANPARALPNAFLLGARGLAVAAALLLAGCSLLFNGDDLHGTGISDRRDMSGVGGVGGSGDGGGSGGSTGSDGGWGGGGGGGSGGSAGSDGGGGGGGGGGRGGGDMGHRLTLSIAASTASPIRIGAAPYGLVLGDFDGDGKLDVATANNGDQSATFLYGAGDGTFAANISRAVPPSSNGCSPYAIVAGDFDNDPRTDVVITCTDLGNTNFGYILKGVSNRMPTPTAIAALQSTAALSPESIAAGDFDHDGKLDLAVGNYQGSSVWIVKGDGHDNFAATASPILELGTNVESVIAGDLDGDGRDDLVAAGYDWSARVSLQSMTGMLGGFTSYNAHGVPSSGILADVNHDHKIDLLLTDATNDAVAVLLGKGDGTFPTGDGTNLPPEFPTHPTPDAIAVGDLDKDGNLDVVTANAAGSSIDVLLGKGDGTFEKAIETTNLTSPSGVRLGDFNGDGLLDIIICSNRSSGTVTLLLNTSQ
jgi:hypothetical protein